MRFALPLASKLPLFASALLALAASACGDKGGDDEAPNTATGPETLFAFDSGTEGFTFQDYTPGDTMYTNIFDVDPANATLTWDNGDGSDGEPGRAKLIMNFSDWNQLADIQLNFMGEDIKDWSGKIIKTKVMVEQG